MNASPKETAAAEAGGGLPVDLRGLDQRDLRFALETLLADYVAILDGGDIERWPDFFTEDGVYKIIPLENYERDLPMAVMFCDSRGMLVDRVTAIRRTLLFAPRALRHITSSMRIEGSDEAGGVRVQTNYVVFENTPDVSNRVFNVGRYLDRVVVEAGRLRYAEKLCVFDTSVVPTSLIYPI